MAKEQGGGRKKEGESESSKSPAVASVGIRGVYAICALVALSLRICFKPGLKPHRSRYRELPFTQLMNMYFFVFLSLSLSLLYSAVFCAC